MARSSAITKPCEACGTAFQAKAADIARGWGRFCSKSCKARQPKGGSAGVPQHADQSAGPDPAYMQKLWAEEVDRRRVAEDEVAVLTKRWDDLAAMFNLPAGDDPNGVFDAVQSAQNVAKAVDSAMLERARRAYSSATGLGTSKTGMFAALKAASEPQEGQG